jgi:hypothetical protein
VGKLTRSKPSRSSRKQDRERRERAVKHGLPAAEPPLPRKVVAVDPGGARESKSLTLSAVTGGPVTDGTFSDRSRTPSLWEQFRRIPPSLQLLGAGILALIAIGLYRRYTEDVPGRNESSGSLTESVVSEVRSAKSSASLARPQWVNSVGTPANSAALSPSAGTHTPPTEPPVSQMKKASSVVVAGTKTHSERKVGRSAQKPASPARSLTGPSPAANVETNAKPSSAENPY